MKNSYLTVAAAAAALLISGARNAQAADADADSDSGARAQYCVQSGGVVIDRLPFYGTNGPPSSWLLLMGQKKFCQFTSAIDGSRIHITLETLYTTKPSLAARPITKSRRLVRAGPATRPPITARNWEVPTCSAESVPRAEVGSARAALTRFWKPASSPTCLRSIPGG